MKTVRSDNLYWLSLKTITRYVFQVQSPQSLLLLLLLLPMLAKTAPAAEQQERQEERHFK